MRPFQKRLGAAGLAPRAGAARFGIHCPVSWRAGPIAPEGAPYSGSGSSPCRAAVQLSPADQRRSSDPALGVTLRRAGPETDAAVQAVLLPPGLERLVGAEPPISSPGFREILANGPSA